MSPGRTGSGGPHPTCCQQLAQGPCGSVRQRLAPCPAGSLRLAVVQSSATSRPDPDQAKVERPEQDAGPSTRAAIAAGSAVPGRRAGSLPGPASSLTASLPLDSGSKATAPAPARAPSFQPNLEPLRSTLTLEFSCFEPGSRLVPTAPFADLSEASRFRKPGGGAVVAHPNACGIGVARLCHLPCAGRPGVSRTRDWQLDTYFRDA